MNYEIIDLRKYLNLKFIIVFTFLIYIIQCSLFVPYTTTVWVDEGNYILKSFWYVNGELSPYSDEDPTWYMPLYFYLLGCWQTFFGAGHVSSRIFNVILSILNLFFLFKISKSLNKKMEYGIMPLILFVLSPFAVWHFITASPIAIVSLLHILGFHLILVRTKKSWWLTSILLGIIYILLFFTRSSMIISVILMLILQLTIHREGRFKRFIVTILMSLSISILIFSYSPEKMGYYALQLPFIIDAIKYIGIYIEPNQDILSSIYHPDYYSIWPTTRFEFSWNRMFVMLRAFFASVVFIHPVIIILNLVSVVSCFIKRKVFQPNCVVSIYFIIILFIHWIGTNTQGSPYVIGNYILHFLFAGSIGSIYGFKELIKRSSMNIAIGMIIILTIVQLCLNIRVLNNNSLVSIYPNYLNEVKELSKVIDDNVPNHEFILPISGSPFYATLGSFYAGNMIELTSIHQNDTYRKFYSDDPTINKLNSLRSLGFWSDELMFNWIENKYDYIILDNGEMANKYRQLVEINFEPVNPPINGYVIYKRK